MTPFMRYLFIALFVIAAVGIGVYAFRVWKDAGKEEKQKHDDEAIK